MGFRFGKFIGPCQPRRFGCSFLKFILILEGEGILLVSRVLGQVLET